MTSAIPTTMNAIRLHAPGGLTDLRLNDVPTPTPGEREVLVQVCAAGITRDELDWPTDRLPAIPSYELSGVVVGGADLSGFEIGDEVYGLTGFDRDGVAAEYATVLFDRLARKPERLSHIESAALTLSGLTAMQGLFDHGELRQDQRVLIHGATGGVGHVAVQLARRAGAHVVATATATRVDTARSFGADEVVDATADFGHLDPVDLVFDTAGGDRLTRSVDVIAPGGRLVSIAEEPPAEQCAKGDIEAVYFVVEPSRSQLGELARLADQGAVKPLVAETYRLDQGPEAFAASLEHRGSGKIVLTTPATTA